MCDIKNIHFDEILTCQYILTNMYHTTELKKINIILKQLDGYIY